MGTAGRKSSATRRKEIARAALDIIGSQGLTKLTTTSIADAIGVTSGALFRHFESREQILCEAVEYGLAEIAKTFPETSLPPVDRFLSLARERIRLLTREPGLAFLLRSDQAFLVLPERAVVRLAEMVQRSRRFVLRLLREGAEQGCFRRDIEAELLLVPVMGTVHALIGASGLRGRDESAREERTERVLDALVRLLAPPQTEHGSENPVRSR